jgi:hypothetical protein
MMLRTFTRRIQAIKNRAVPQDKIIPFFSPLNPKTTEAEKQITITSLSPERESIGMTRNNSQGMKLSMKNKSSFTSRIDDYPF